MPGFINTSLGFRHVHAYPEQLLRLTLAGVCIPVSYRRSWQDGFGARGWKLRAALADPAIIASTRDCGSRIPTSVLVHDMLDHLLSGFDISGHRAEAMALARLGRRTGSDIRGDYLQMVDEDLLQGRVNGEPLAGFVPRAWLVTVAPARHYPGRELVRALTEQFGEQGLRQRLLQRFIELGERGTGHAEDSWRLLGLDPARAGAIGLALQQILERVDRRVEQSGIEQLQATFIVSNERCTLRLHQAHAVGLASCHVASVI